MQQSLPELPNDLADVAAWVDRNLAGLFSGNARRSGAFVGGQASADQALAGLDLDGYAASRSRVDPYHQRGASKLSPYIRHGLLTLCRVKAASEESGSANDRFRFQSELLWQDYSRHWYAVEGAGTRLGVKREPAKHNDRWVGDPWRNSMACTSATMDELHADGWVVNQARMWLASQWAVRGAADWRDGEDYMFRHLLDGSRAANRQGWQWVIGATRDRAYGFARKQVLKQAPEFCESCALSDACPIENYGEHQLGAAVERSEFGDVAEKFGPPEEPAKGSPEVVWLTAESLGDEDPALGANPGLPAVFVFDVALLKRLMLDGKRLVFLAECLADLATRRTVQCFAGDPVEVMKGRNVAVTFAPVPGFRRRAAELDPGQVVLYPWPYLRPPTASYIERLSTAMKFPPFSAWSRWTSR